MNDYDAKVLAFRYAGVQLEFLEGPLVGETRVVNFLSVAKVVRASMTGNVSGVTLDNAKVEAVTGNVSGGTLDKAKAEAPATAKTKGDRASRSGQVKDGKTVLDLLLSSRHLI